MTEDIKYVILKSNKGLLLLTYKMEYHDVARAYKEAGRLGNIYQAKDKCCPSFFIRREEEFFIEQIKYYYTEQSPGDSRRTV